MFGDGVLATLLNSPAVAELVKTLAPLALSRLNGQQQQPQDAPPPALVPVELGGEVVQMTPAAVAALKRRLAELTEKADGAAASQAETTPGPPPSAPAAPPAPPEPVAAAPQRSPAGDSGDQPKAADGPSAPAAGEADGQPAELSDALRADFVHLGDEFLADSEAKSPEEYANFLKDQARPGNYARAIVDFLGCAATYERVIDRVRPYKRYEDLKPYIERLEQKREYIVTLITAVTGSGSSPSAGASA